MLYQGKKMPLKTKLMPAKLRPVLANFISDFFLSKNRHLHMTKFFRDIQAKNVIWLCANISARCQVGSIHEIKKWKKISWHCRFKHCFQPSWLIKMYVCVPPWPGWAWRQGRPRWWLCRVLPPLHRGCSLAHTGGRQARAPLEERQIIEAGSLEASCLLQPWKVWWKERSKIWQQVDLS